MPTHKYKNVPSKPDHEIEDLVDAIKAVMLEKKAKKTVAAAFKIPRTTLRRYISKVEEAQLDISSATDQNLFEFVFNLSEKSGGKKVCTLTLICFF